MYILDPTTPIGKVRLRVADAGSDFQVFPDSVYAQTIIDCNNSLPRASTLMAQYILGTLTSSVTEKLGGIQVMGSEYFQQYKEFLKLTVLNPNLMTLSPLPYSSSGTTIHPLQQFVTDWNLNYAYGTQSDALHIQALGGFAGTINIF